MSERNSDLNNTIDYEYTHSENSEEKSIFNVSGDFVEDRCRYCYKDMEFEKNVSSCKCNGLLCKSCLLNELILTLNRGDRKIHCTACKENYQVKETKKERKIVTLWNFIYYCVYTTYPMCVCVPKKVWVKKDNNKPSLKTCAFTVALTLWICFTTLIDYCFGMEVNPVLRAVIFFCRHHGDSQHV